LDEDRDEVLRRAIQQAATTGLRMKSQGPVKLARGAEVGVRLSIPDLTVSPPSNVLLWEGTIANAGFNVSVPADMAQRSCPGEAVFHVGGVPLARLAFVLKVGGSGSWLVWLKSLFRSGVAIQKPSTPAAPSWLESKARRYHRAFASYAREDTREVLARIQGIQTAAPDMDVFFDVGRLRSGERWEQRLREEVVSREVLYLFWSKAAKASVWVDQEWRWGYEAHGADFISPVPLESPDEAAPPPELAALHFDDCWNFMRRGH